MYTIKYNLVGVPQIIRDSDGAWIPCDERNGDYIRFLEWNNEQTEPLDPVEKCVPEKTEKEQKRFDARQFLAELKSTPANKRTQEDLEAALNALIDLI